MDALKAEKILMPQLNAAASLFLRNKKTFTELVPVNVFPLNEIILQNKEMLS